MKERGSARASGPSTDCDDHSTASWGSDALTRTPGLTVSLPRCVRTICSDRRVSAGPSDVDIVEAAVVPARCGQAASGPSSRARDKRREWEPQEFTRRARLHGGKRSQLGEACRVVFQCAHGRRDGSTATGRWASNSAHQSRDSQQLQLEGAHLAWRRQLTPQRPSASRHLSSVSCDTATVPLRLSLCTAIRGAGVVAAPCCGRR